MKKKKIMISKDLNKLEKKLGVKFNDKELFLQSLTHRSYLNEHPDFKLDHNERLEFLGDAVLEIIVTEYLYQTYPNPEGELTNWRAALVNADMLAIICERIGVEDYLMMSRGEAKDAKSKARRYILANAFEAIIGAIYLDAGWDAAKGFITKNVLSELPRILEEQTYVDPKSRFQETAQEKMGVTPTYKVLSETGPDHAKIFEVGVYVNKNLIATGSGSSKQEAQVAAAAEALKKSDW